MLHKARGAKQGPCIGQKLGWEACGQGSLRAGKVHHGELNGRSSPHGQNNLTPPADLVQEELCQLFPRCAAAIQREDFSSSRRTSPARTQSLPLRSHQAVGGRPQLGLHADAAHVEQHLLWGLRPPRRRVAPATRCIRCSKGSETQAERSSRLCSCSTGPVPCKGAGGRRAGGGSSGRPEFGEEHPSSILTLQDLTMMIPEFL